MYPANMIKALIKIDEAKKVLQECSTWKRNEYVFIESTGLKLFSINYSFVAQKPIYIYRINNINAALIVHCRPSRHDLSDGWSSDFSILWTFLNDARRHLTTLLLHSLFYKTNLTQNLIMLNNIQQYFIHCWILENEINLTLCHLMYLLIRFT